MFNFLFKLKLICFCWSSLIWFFSGLCNEIASQRMATLFIQIKYQRHKSINQTLIQVCQSKLQTFTNVNNLLINRIIVTRNKHFSKSRPFMCQRKALTNTHKKCLTYLTFCLTYQMPDNREDKQNGHDNTTKQER